MVKRPAAVSIAIVIAFVMTLVLTWGVGELHYRNCTQDVEIRYGKAANGDGAPVSYALEREINRIKSPGRYKDLDACSRLPF